MEDESWRAFVTLSETYEQFGPKYFDRVQMMAPNLKPMITAWKKLMQIDEPRESKPNSIKKQKVNQMKIERLLIREHKLQDTPAPRPPDPDCVPFRLRDGKLFICKNENGTIVTYSTAITGEWQGVAERIKAEDAFHSFLMTLNDSEFQEYLRLKRR